MRACLAASATTALLTPRRTFRAMPQRLVASERRASWRITARVVDQQHAELDIAAFGNPTQPSGAAASMLSRRHSRPRRTLATLRDGTRIANRRHQRGGGHRPHTGDWHEPLGGLRLPSQLRHSAIVDRDAVLQRLQAIGQIGEDFTGQHRQLRRLQQLRQRSP